jgi:FdhD protein
MQRTEPPSSPTWRTRIMRLGEQNEPSEDLLAREEPVELRLGYAHRGRRVARSLSITMRTPGDDFDLALGFLWTEGIVRDPAQIAEVRFCGVPEGQTRSNVVRVELADGVRVDVGRLQRHFYTSSSCGVCGKTSLEAVAATGCPTLAGGPVVSSRMISDLPTTLRSAQAVFEQTGGLHAAGWFDTDGRLLALREDVGRHNAVDKLVGHALQVGALPLSTGLLVVSGRASFELVQKAVMAGFPIMVAVGAPSSLAVELARERGLTLVGFVRRESCNVYSGAERLVDPMASALTS